MYIAKQKQIHQYREQTSGYQWEEGRRGGARYIQTTMYLVNKQEGYIVHHREI